ncbi:hypothetical protein SCAR479_04879 [Seiridium cardinale]|uniref:Uncharacterized protein n=1 Tax=Seiridium cardinale TaxID=138064 RepID=A0ABR2Y5F4_9PEZI
MYPTQIMRMQATRRMLRAPPTEDQAGHTVSQRLRKLRKIPAELIPLGEHACLHGQLQFNQLTMYIGVVVGFAVFAAGYSSTRKFFVDKNLRLQRQNRAADSASEHH